MVGDEVWLMMRVMGYVRSATFLAGFVWAVVRVSVVGNTTAWILCGVFFAGTVASVLWQLSDHRTDSPTRRV